MSDRIKPNIVLIPTPYGIDKYIQDIQISLTAVNELKYIFGRARRNKIKEANKEITIPETYRSKGKYINLLPNRDYSNFCFFFVNDPINFIDYEANENTFKRSARVSLIFWFTFDKIDISKDWLFTEQIKESIYSVLNQNSNIKLIQEYENLSNVFAGFTVEEIDIKYFKFPHYGYRLDFDLFYENTCI